MIKKDKCGLTRRNQIPAEYWLVAIVGKSTKSRFMKTFFQAVLAGGSTYGLDTADYWVLIFDCENLLGAFLTGGIFEAAQDYLKDVCGNLASLSSEKLQELYFFESPERVEMNNRYLAGLKWIECELVRKV